MTSTPQDFDATAQSADPTDFAERLKLVRKRAWAAALDDVNARVADLQEDLTKLKQLATHEQP